ncbi:MAG TPA: hypothetical protein VIJ41_12165 [Candidatus Nanopelagicales bacterium]
MELTPYLTDLRNQLAAAAEPGGPEARDLAERLGATLESTFRLALLDALSVATAEITQELAPVSVELRLRGRDPEFVVVVPPAPSVVERVAPESLSAPVTGDDDAMTRINLRLGQDLKDRVEDAARAAGMSVNSWLVRAAASAVADRPAAGSPTWTTARGSSHYRGWAR